jgi:hypothetical protein
MHLSLALLVLLLLLGCNNNQEDITLPPSPPSALKKLTTPSEDTLYIGAFANYGHQENQISRERIEAFETLINKRIAWAYITNTWDKGIRYPHKNIQTIWDNEQVPFIRFLPRSDHGANDTHKDSVYSLQNIIDGQFDKAFIQWARESKLDNIPLLIDFGVEMTGNWMPWSGIYNGAGKTDGYGDPTYPDGPERYRDAYRHIIDIFRKEGANHITWFFHPDIQRIPDKEWNSAKYYYPGDDYIDWIGLSIYGALTLSDTEKLFSTALKKGYPLIYDISDTKPIALLEFGVAERGDEKNKKAWIEDAFNAILYNPYIEFKAISYWHETWKNDDGTSSKLKIDSSPQSLHTFTQLIQNPRFLSKATFIQE